MMRYDATMDYTQTDMNRDNERDMWDAIAGFDRRPRCAVCGLSLVTRRGEFVHGVSADHRAVAS
jgi:hypothetical protein